MLDKNVVLLSGISGDDVKFCKASNGKDYCTFLLLITTFEKEMGDVDAHTRSMDMIRIMVFNNKKTKLVDYLKKIGFRRGMRVTIFGRIQSYKTEVKGNSIIQNNVLVRDIEVVQTSATGDKKENI